MKANHTTPSKAPRNGVKVAFFSLAVKRVKSAPAVTQAKLKAAT